MSDRISRARETRVAMLRTGLGLMFGLLLSGCLGRSPTVEHFMLGKIDGPPQVSSSDEPGLAVLVGPVKLPAYLERPQIARLEENGEVELEEFSRWLGGFEENFLRSTSLGLARKLDSIKVVVPPSSPPFSLDYRVRFHVDDFVFVTDRDVLRARIRWALISEGKESAPQLFLMEVSQPVEDGSSASLVEAHEVVIAELVSRIAIEIERSEASAQAEGL
jgi:uncharacterized lipoprotein YmbA